MKLFDTESLAWYLLRNLHDGNYDVVEAVLNGYTNAVEDRLMQTIPVMETNLEGAQKRIVEAIESMEWFIGAMEKAMEDDGYPASTLSSLHTHATNLEYIGVFLDRLNDHIEAAKTRHDLTPTP